VAIFLENHGGDGALCKLAAVAGVDEPEAIGIITAVRINVFPVSDANIRPVSTFIQIKRNFGIISNLKRNLIRQL